MIKYTTVDRILSIINRELGDANSFTDDDIIEWIGEAMEFLSIYPTLEERVVVLNVKNNRAYLPNGTVNILQLAKLNSVTKVIEYIKKEVKETIKDECDCNTIIDECSNNNPIEFSYTSFIKTCTENKGISLIRASNNKFFKSHCKDERLKELYNTSEDEYTIIGTDNKELLFSFNEGTVVMSYTSIPIDNNTGYPLIPDQSDFIAAVTYYIKWKISEAMSWRGREGYSQLLQYARSEWLRYVKQAKNWAKMPKTLDDYQTLLEGSYKLIPDLKKYFKK